MASGINTCRIGGLAIGVAALGAVFQHQLTGGSPRTERRPAPAVLVKSMASGGTHADRPVSLATPASRASAHACVDGSNRILRSVPSRFARAVCAFTCPARHRRPRLVDRPDPDASLAVSASGRT